MRALKFSLVGILLSITSCIQKVGIIGDKGVVVGITKDGNRNNVEILIINDSIEYNSNTYIIFPTQKQYHINDTIYLVNYR